MSVNEFLLIKNVWMTGYKLFYSRCGRLVSHIPSEESDIYGTTVMHSLTRAHSENKCKCVSFVGGTTPSPATTTNHYRVNYNPTRCRDNPYYICIIPASTTVPYTRFVHSTVGTKVQFSAGKWYFCFRLKTCSFSG